MHGLSEFLVDCRVHLVDAGVNAHPLLAYRPAGVGVTTINDRKTNLPRRGLVRSKRSTAARTMPGTLVLGMGSLLLAASGCTVPSHFIDYCEGQTALLVVNTTHDSVQIRYAPSQDQQDKPGTVVQYTLPGDESIRLTGHKGDTLTITSADGSPFTVLYGTRSQVVQIARDGSQTTYHLRRGFNE